MQPFYLLEAVDVRRADIPDSGRPHILSKLALPGIKFKGADHTPGGGNGTVNFRFTQIEALEPKFETKGLDTDALSSLGLFTGSQDKWVFAGAWRNKQSGVMVPSRAIIQGVVAEWEPDEQTPGELVGCNHMISEVTHYELHLAGKEIIYWDFWERETRMNGVSLTSAIRAALGG